jgi:S-adenosylmethionine:tRNA ribosyltransferase-isomerase
MRVDLFDYDLPEDLIAQEPPPERTASRMMVLGRAARAVEHRLFTDLPRYLRAGDCLVLNDTRVLAARLRGRRPSGGEVEILLLRPRGPLVWQTLARPARRVRVGESLDFGPGLRATVLAEGEEGLRELRFEADEPFDDLLERLGEPPLPPYVRRRPRPEDRERYQTVYARRSGAVAAPTAGLHFDAPMLARLQAEGVATIFLTLHVGLGTFRPVTVEKAEDHVMHAEPYHVSSEAADAINRARAAGGRIVAVGTTVVRTLETVADRTGLVRPGEGETDLFVTPGYTFRAVDAMLTNFHLPRSTLLMMVSAFAGREFVLDAYRQAIAELYRFFSYGDCMLIL